MEIPPNDYGEFEPLCTNSWRSKISRASTRSRVKLCRCLIFFRFGSGPLVGPTGSGKSTIWRVLAQTMSKLRQSGSNDERAEVIFSILNPKCITMGELYGEMNTLTSGSHRPSCVDMSHQPTIRMASQFLDCFRWSDRCSLDREHEHGPGRQYDALPRER